MRVCQFRHDGKWTSIVAAARRLPDEEDCSTILQAGWLVSNDRGPDRDLSDHYF